MRSRSSFIKNRILLSAEELFLEHGYTATRMDQIAIKSGVTKRTLYGYFSNKQTLFDGVMKLVVGETLSSSESRNDITTMEELISVLREMLATINKIIMQPRYTKLLRVIVGESNQQPELRNMFRKGVTYQALQSLTGIFDAAIGCGLLKSKDPELLARFFLGGPVTHLLLDGLLAQHVSVQEQTEEEVTNYVSEFVRCIAL